MVVNDFMIIDFLKRFQFTTGRAFLQLCIIFVGIAFEVIGTGWGRFTMLWLYEDSFRGFVYNTCEHLKFIALVLLMWLSPARAADYKTDGLFVVLAMLDFGDYLLTGNSVWFGIGTKPMFPVSMNMFSILVFTLYAHNQWKMNIGRDLY